MSKRSLLVLGAAVLAAVAAAQAARVLVINSSVASSDVRIINGRAYAPITDIAKALGMTVTVNGNRYELSRPGGTGQLDGLNGKTGDWLFDGGWRFRVNRAYFADTYEAKNDWYGDNTFQPEAGKKMVVVEYSYRNGNRSIQPFSINAALLASDGGRSAKLYSNDFNFDGSRLHSQPVLPGAQAEGALIFFVPSDFAIKDVVLTLDGLTGYDEAVRPKQNTVFRVAAATEADGR